jgi:hypothetical protein
VRSVGDDAAARRQAAMAAKVSDFDDSGTSAPFGIASG